MLEIYFISSDYEFQVTVIYLFLAFSFCSPFLSALYPFLNTSFLSPSFLPSFFFFNIYLFIWLTQVLVVVHGVSLVALRHRDSSSPTRDWIRTPCTARRTPNNRTTREVSFSFLLIKQNKQLFFKLWHTLA